MSSQCVHRETFEQVSTEELPLDSVDKEIRLAEGLRVTRTLTHTALHELGKDRVVTCEVNYWPVMSGIGWTDVTAISETPRSVKCEVVLADDGQSDLAGAHGVSGHSVCGRNAPRRAMDAR